MNKNYSFASVKTILIMLFIMMVFFLLLAKAFDYIPKEDDVTPTARQNPAVHRVVRQNTNPQASLQNELNITESENGAENEENSTLQESEPEQNAIPAVEQNNSQAEPRPSAEEELKPIDDSEISGEPIPNPENGNTEPVQETLQSKLDKANQLKESGDYDAAIEIYKNIAAKERSQEMAAGCYDEIVKIYILQKRYGSALVYAQKAGRLSPSQERSAMIQKLAERIPSQTTQRTNY